MALTLEDFDGPRAPAPAYEPAPAGPDPDAAEAARIGAYEQGYKAGWDDAAQAEAESQARIGADFARSLQELSFTFHEARTHVMQSMEPLLAELVDTLLPALVADTLGARILEEIQPMIDESADAPVELVVAPASRPALERQLQGGATPIRIAEEPSLAEGQAYLRLGKTERDIDMTSALERIREAIRALYALNERTLKYG